MSMNLLGNFHICIRVPLSYNFTKAGLYRRYFFENFLEFPKRQFPEVLLSESFLIFPDSCVILSHTFKIRQITAKMNKSKLTC